MARFRILFCAALLLAAMSAQAHEGATGIVKERMTVMEEMANGMKEIRRRIIGSPDFPAIASAAARIGALAERLPQLFPPGSNGRPSEALPAVWQQWPKFQAEAEQLVQETGKLAQSAASGEPRELAAQYRSLGQVCLIATRRSERSNDHYRPSAKRGRTSRPGNTPRRSPHMAAFFHLG